MKKVSLTLVAVLMLISLASCNKSESGNASKNETFTGPESGTLVNYKVKIDSYVITKNNFGKDAVIINYEWLNNSDKEAAFFYVITTKVTQNGVECNLTGIKDETIYKGTTPLEYVKPGKTLKVQLAYTLQDTKTPINVELQEAANKAPDAPKVTRTFNIA